MNTKQPLVIFIMGVSGVGKSNISKLVAKKPSIPFVEGDDFHPQKNIKKNTEGPSKTFYHTNWKNPRHD